MCCEIIGEPVHHLKEKPGIWIEPLYSLGLRFTHDHPDPFDFCHLDPGTFRYGVFTLSELAGPQFPTQLYGANG